MASHRIAGSLLIGAAFALSAGCGNQPAKILAPDGITTRATRIGQGEDPGPGPGPAPTLCFFNAYTDYCYPAASYCQCPETEVVTKVYANSSVTMNWSAEPAPGRTVRAFRWALDIEDITDQTPRIDEATDLAHWSAPSATATTATLGSWNGGEAHKLYVEVEDDMGWKSLGVVRFESRSGRPILPPGAMPAQQAVRVGDEQ
jgi:hypothetical protein